MKEVSWCGLSLVRSFARLKSAQVSRRRSDVARLVLLPFHKASRIYAPEHSNLLNCEGESRPRPLRPSTAFSVSLSRLTVLQCASPFLVLCAPSRSDIRTSTANERQEHPRLHSNDRSWSHLDYARIRTLQACVAERVSPNSRTVQLVYAHPLPMCPSPGHIQTARFIPEDEPRMHRRV